jgi:hypothetical protein
MTEAALAAKAIRKVLKEKFPAIKFSVRSSNFSMGNSVDIPYKDGVPAEEIDKAVRKYQFGNFDPMTDSYDYSNCREDIPQAKYVHVQRNISPEVRERVKADIANDFGINNPEDEREWQRVFRSWSDQVVWSRLSKMTIAA